MTTKPKAKAKAKPQAKPRASKPKAAPKPPLEQTPITTNEGAIMADATQDAPTEKKTPKPAAKRDYRITKELKLDLTDPVSLINQLKSAAGLGEDDEITGPVTVLAVVGTGNGINPPSALKQYGADNDMAGDYEVVAVPNIVVFKNVTTAQKRDVSFA